MTTDPTAARDREIESIAVALWHLHTPYAASRPTPLDQALNDLIPRLRALAGAPDVTAIDLPDRFRAAADVAGFEGHEDAYGNLMRVSYWLEHMPPHVVETITRALQGETTTETKGG